MSLLMTRLPGTNLSLCAKFVSHFWELPVPTDISDMPATCFFTAQLPKDRSDIAKSFSSEMIFWGAQVGPPNLFGIIF